MTENVYSPPKTELIQNDGSISNKFYIVSKTKLSILYISTLGIYLTYWFYVNWKNYRQETGQDLWPVARAIFYIFFTHSLFREVDKDIKLKQLAYKWQPGGLATLFVLLTITAQIFDNIAEHYILSPYSALISLTLLPIIFLLILLKAQGAINLSQHDANGDSNSNFTIYNFLWIVPGLILWGVIGVGFFSVL